VIRVGTAGWSYADWEGIVYPAVKPRGFQHLTHLARFVQCVEVNSSFYALPRAEHAEGWLERIQDRPGFRFTAKVHQDFSHGPLPSAAARGAWDAHARAYLEGLEPLVRAGRLAALLLQFPASFVRSPQGEQRLERCSELLTASACCPLVVELRHRSWFEPPALARLAGLGLSVAHLDLPAAPDHAPDWHEPTGALGYLRLHGRNGGAWFRPGAGRDARYDYLYGPREMDELAAKARRLAGRCDETYVITNNHFEGKALANALDLRALLEEGAVAAPAELVTRYPHLSRSTRSDGQLGLF
jgi:uncharacterized protein YecE (DUF72 family)